MGVLESKYRLAMEKPLKVLEIFNDFFGENRVDLQGFTPLEDIERVLPENASMSAVKDRLGIQGFILVHFPQVTVTNEYNKSTDISHLFAKVAINIRGEMLGRFTLNRSEYSLLHIDNGYMHSHVSQIPFSDFSQFQQPCTGSGPINNTICSLSREFDEDIWRLFCLELDKFVRVESIAGTPYHRLEDLVSRGRSFSEIATCSCYSNSMPRGRLSRVTISKFIKHLIDSEILGFRYINGEYKVAASSIDTVIKVSNCFIDWYNKELRKGTESESMQDLLDHYCIIKCKFSNGKLLQPLGGGAGRRNYNSYIGSRVCTFKGREVTLSIEGLENQDTQDENDIVILNPSTVDYILTKIINVLNLRYGDKTNNTTSKKVFFI